MTYGKSYDGTPAENYQRFFVPAIGAPVADDLIGVAPSRPGDGQGAVGEAEPRPDGRIDLCREQSELRTVFQAQGISDAASQGAGFLIDRVPF